jgi:NAD(P)-dependent dehydrogenase (short-subunit alcohol dehydrogenase family)
MMRPMRILITGGAGVLGRVTVPLLRDSGHHVATPSSSELDLFDAKRYERQSAILTRCCTWPPASLVRIARGFPVPGTRTIGCVSTRPDCWLTAL